MTKFIEDKIMKRLIYGIIVVPMFIIGWIFMCIREFGYIATAILISLLTGCSYLSLKTLSFFLLGSI